MLLIGFESEEDSACRMCKILLTLKITGLENSFANGPHEVIHGVVQVFP